jgi:recombination protein RecA
LNEAIKQKLESERARMEKKYGYKSAAIGSTQESKEVVPTGILSLDYALGLGGWPRRAISEVYGAPDIGKSSVIGLSAIKQAQKLGLVCGIVAVEPTFDPDWAIKNGVDPELLLIGRPDDGEDAFQIMYDWVRGDLIDFVLFDSIGALLRPSEVDEKGKPSQGGQSGLITWGIKRCVMPTFKNNKCVILLNQIRDDMDARVTGLYESPGGWALKHSAPIRVFVRGGKEKWTEKDNDGSKDGIYDVTVGRELICKIVRNKMAEGTNTRASFNYFSKETDDEPFGIDVATDVLRTGIRTGVIARRGAYYHNPAFPEMGKEKEHKLYGKDAVADYIAEHPEVVDLIRHEVITVMHAQMEKEGKVVSEDGDE